MLLRISFRRRKALSRCCSPFVLFDFHTAGPAVVGSFTLAECCFATIGICLHIISLSLRNSVCEGDSNAFNVRCGNMSLTVSYTVSLTDAMPSFWCQFVVAVAAAIIWTHIHCVVPLPSALMQWLVMIGMNFSFVKIITQFCGLNRSFILFHSCAGPALFSPSLVWVGCRFVPTKLGSHVRTSHIGFVVMAWRTRTAERRPWTQHLIGKTNKWKNATNRGAHVRYCVCRSTTLADSA